MTVIEAQAPETLPARLREQMLATRDQPRGDTANDHGDGVAEGIFEQAVRHMVHGSDDNLLDLDDLQCRMTLTLENAPVSRAENADTPPPLTFTTQPDCGVTFTLDAAGQAVCLATLTGAKTFGSTARMDGPLTRELITKLAGHVVEKFAASCDVTLPPSPVWTTEDTALQESPDPQFSVAPLAIAIPQKRMAALLKQQVDTVLGRISVRIRSDLLQSKSAEADTKASTVRDAVLGSELDLRITAPARKMSLQAIGDLSIGDVIGLPDDRLALRACAEDERLLEGVLVQVGGNEVFCVNAIDSPPVRPRR